FTIAIAAGLALLPLTSTAPTSTDLSDTTQDDILYETFDGTLDETLDETPNTSLLPRGNKPPKSKIPPISIRTYLQAGGAGTPWYFPKVAYNKEHLANYTSYSISRDLLPGEVLDIMGNNKLPGGRELTKDLCAVVTSHTPQGLKKGCYELGGESGGKVATCFRLWKL
ncbi:MAG: hypothetical protein Q9184_006409, partial [Pyrenodesmia sp. 2 TL-2023]